ncbi:Polyisoprenoid-binding protein YceI [Chitinophaga costaii]|uniref:Polyisoprenoid-binding protein YceI n=1 Tax=Chitinophaga costaii TaxID=1335309 RepID=A0A1C4CWW2_9BACT|nr:YceI family protein [Chitinophaga costaii]PUZ26912.1 hypothetical protein DCM91_06630 [Chitinophaga costaii]SCC23498.1 Polyisoprenoid-binding protein YceI [Chitinophaga costaii]
MQFRKKPYQIILIAALLCTGIVLYGTACTHDDAVLPASYSGGSATDPTNYVTRGSDVITFSTTAGTGVYTFDKVHSNVMWESRFLGSGAILSGRFNWFGFNTFNFDEATPANTTFTAWVQLNQVNTGEPARDGGCLLTAFNTTATADIPVSGEPTNDFNRALIQSKTVTYNPTENIYDVVCDLTFMGVTKEVKAKLGYAGKGTYPGTTNLLRGFDLRFSLSITTFPLKADQDEVNDNIDIVANANFKQ